MESSSASRASRRVRSRTGSVTSWACSAPPGSRRAASSVRRSTQSASLRGCSSGWAQRAAFAGGAATEATVDRNLALELVLTTEYAALAAVRWIGRGDIAGAPAAYGQSRRAPGLGGLFESELLRAKRQQL